MKSAALYRLLTFLLLSQFLANNLQAQPNKDYFFQKLTTHNGLSSNFIQCIYRDSRDYVWIGTRYGLNCYDGRNMKVYHHDPANPHSLANESVSRITEDKNGNLWMSAGDCLTEFNPFTEQFTNYSDEAGNLKSAGNYPQPLVDSKYNLWIGSNKGLQLFNRKDRTFETFLLAPADSIMKNPGIGYAGGLAEDKDHNIWCCGINGLYKMDPLKRELKLYPFQGKSYGEIIDLYIDHEGVFWVVLRLTGICKFNPGTGIFESIPSFKINRLSLFGKMSEWKDHDGVYWLTICTERGLYLYNPESGEKAIIQHDPEKPNSLVYNGTFWVYTDKDHRLWIGTMKGLNILECADQAFHSRQLVRGNFSANKQSNVNIEAIYEDSGIKMVSYIREQGLGVYDANWDQNNFYPSIPPSDTSAGAKSIFDIYKDFRGIYWITTNNGLVRFDIKNNLFKLFIPADDDKTTGKWPNSMRKITPFDSSCFYIRSSNQGIYKFDFIKEQFVQHLVHRENEPTSLPFDELRAILKDNDNRLIIVSIHDGIAVFDPVKNSYEMYNRDADAAINEALKAQHFDPCLSGNILWLNTLYGLLKFNLVTKKFELLNSKNGLANDALVSNEVDDYGNVWVAHNAGISRFDTSSRTFTNFTENNGLTFELFGDNMRKMADGTICIGDRDRIIYFNPAQFKTNVNIPQVHINSVQVLNEPFPITIDSVTRKKSLTLDYKQDLITVDFSVLNFSHPKENRFYYRLDQDSSWHQVNEGMVNLVRLSPGKYVLHVTGSNDSGILNPTGDALYLRILPPFYQTWWFIAFIVAGVLLILYFIQRFRINNITNEEHLKTEFNKQLAQAETKALRAQMNPHFIFNSLNSINSFVMDQKHEIASDYLIKFSKLIRLILDNSRSEMISIEKELETLKLYVLLETARFDNRFRCVYHIAEDVNINSIMIPPMLLQPFVENAIWHGLMQKEGNGTITVEIKKQDEEFLNISISDDGIGREKAAELKSKSATHKSHGLKVTSQRIEMMNKLNSSGATVNIFDLKDEQGYATGTKVELIIPI